MKLSALFIALIPLLGSPVIHAETTAAPVLENRAAQEISPLGGARRLTGDQTEALRASLINKPAKNVILLIGDGMGGFGNYRCAKLCRGRAVSLKELMLCR